MITFRISYFKFSTFKFKNLDSKTYSVMEEDPVKYSTYETAIARYVISVSVSCEIVYFFLVMIIFRLSHLFLSYTNDNVMFRIRL